jgi:hypothetical protein
LVAHANTLHRALRLAGLPVLALLGACGSTPESTPSASTVQGRLVTLTMRSGVGGFGNEAARVGAQLAAQKPAELDQPLRATRLRWLREDSEDRLDGLVMQFAIDPEGRPTGTRMLRAPRTAPGVGLPVDAFRALTEWRFAPPLKAGVPVGYCCVQLTTEAAPR